MHFDLPISIYFAVKERFCTVQEWEAQTAAIEAAAAKLEGQAGSSKASRLSTILIQCV